MGFHLLEHCMCFNHRPKCSLFPIYLEYIDLGIRVEVGVGPVTTKTVLITGFYFPSPQLWYLLIWRFCLQGREISYSLGSIELQLRLSPGPFLPFMPLTQLINKVVPLLLSGVADTDYQGESCCCYNMDSGKIILGIQIILCELSQYFHVW